MSPEQREQMNRLCKSIQNEKEPKKFTALMDELLLLLESAAPHPTSRKQS